MTAPATEARNDSHGVVSPGRKEPEEPCTKIIESTTVPATALHVSLETKDHEVPRTKSIEPMTTPATELQYGNDEVVPPERKVAAESCARRIELMAVLSFSYALSHLEALAFYRSPSF